ncbi:MAG: hypothetical protein OEY11_04030 [Gammaproteobacteria bacterium]|nr:hypothetical protein [Gammaproteobacteria bacterium]
MKKTAFTFFALQLAALLLIFPALSSAADESSISIESRDSYTRWYEYPGVYYEEEFSFVGVRADYYFNASEGDVIKYGFTGSLYPAGSYTSWPSEDESAFAARAGFIGQARLAVNDSMKLILQAEVTYLVALGTAGGGSHSDDFAVYLPSVSAGAGLLFNNMEILGASSLSVMYMFGLFELGVDTDNYVSGSPVTEDWSDSAISVVLNYGF